MKNTIILSSILFSLWGCSSEFEIVSSDVPAAVTSAFQEKYPTAADVEWEAEKTEGHLAFEAEFKIEGKKKEAYFKSDGSFLKEE